MKKRIVHIVLNLNPYNNRTRIHRMSNSLSKAGYDVKVVCLHEKKIKQPDSEQFEGFRINRINITTRNLPGVFNSIKYLEFLLKAYTVIRSFKPQIIHCHDLDTLPVGVMASNKAKIIYDAHELETNRSGISRFKSLVVGFLESILTRFVSECLTVNHEIAEILRNKYKIRAHAIFNAYSASEIKRDGQVTIRKRINVGNDKFITIYPGVLSYNRGLLKLIESFRYLHRDVVIVMIGYGPKKEELRKEVKKRNLQDRIFVLDAVPYDVVIQYIASADLGLMPTLNTALSYQLGLGNKFFQYVAAGIPLAVSDQPVKKKLLEKYNLGVVFNPENPDDIAEKINSIAMDKTKYFELKENCINAQQFLCWENEELKLMRIYSELIK